MAIEYYDCCGNCTEYSKDEEYCSYYKEYFKPGDSCRYQKNRETYGNEGCYVTTVVCNILGYGDNCGVLNTLRDMRYTMQEDPRCKVLLYEYDLIGPKVAECIRKDYNETKDKEMWIQYFNFYIQRSASLYSEGRTEEAIIRYKEMFDSLKKYYCVDIPYIIPQDYDVENGGHGKVKTIGIHPEMNK